jgi:hypothetical protein
MKFNRLVGALALRVFLGCLALAAVMVLGGAAVSAAEDVSVSSLRDILLVLKPSCRVDSKWTRLGCAAVLHFNGDWTGVKLCRAGHCVMFEEVLGER